MPPIPSSWRGQGQLQLFVVHLKMKPVVRNVYSSYWRNREWWTGKDARENDSRIICSTTPYLPSRTNRNHKKSIRQYSWLKGVHAHGMKADRGSRGTAPPIHNLDTRWTWVVHFTSQPQCPGIHWTRRLGGLHSRCECFWEEEKSLAPTRIRTSYRSAYCLWSQMRYCLNQLAKCRSIAALCNVTKRLLHIGVTQ